MIDATDRAHLERCVALAAEALEAGHEPFGSILVDADGATRLEAKNEVGGGDATQHPEFAIARWAAAHLSPASAGRPRSTRTASTARCARPAHAWVGLGANRLRLLGRAADGVAGRNLGLSPPRCALAINEVAPGVPVDGPDADLAEAVRELHARTARR